MDVLVLLEDGDEREAAVDPAAPSGARLLAYVRSGPGPETWGRPFGRRGAGSAREVVTLCGAPDADMLAVALAAAVEGRRLTTGAAPVIPASAVRHLQVSPEAGAVGDGAWRDRATGQLVSREVAITPGVLAATASQLLADAGRLIRQTVAELATPEWPEGARRAISVVLPVAGDAPGDDDALLALVREADGHAAAYAGYHDEPA